LIWSVGYIKTWLLAELVAYLLPSYKDFTPTELITPLTLFTASLLLSFRFSGAGPRENQAVEPRSEIV
jgi:hypothetical protein